MKNRKGQALVTLIFFVLFATTITTAAVVIMVVNSLNGTRLQDGTIAYEVAQSGVDNALIRLLRNPSYTGESSLPVGSGSATITVTGSGTSSDPYVILSSGSMNGFRKKIQVQATYQNNKMNVLSQKELF